MLSVRNRRGFTLIEALVVVAILGIVMTMAMPAVERSILKQRADRAAHVISADLQEVFALAARTRKPVRIWLLSNPPRLVAEDRVTSANLMRRFYSEKDSPYRLTSWNPSASSFQVFPNGVAAMASPQLTITINVGSQTRTVTVRRLGQIRITSP